MAVAVVMEFSGGTVEQYDQVIDKMGFTAEGQGPPGAISHWAAGTDDGLLVTDVWETREQFDRFAQEQIGPFSAEVGITEPPKMTFYEVHNYLTAG